MEEDKKNITLDADAENAGQAAAAAAAQEHPVLTDEVDDEIIAPGAPVLDSEDVSAVLVRNDESVSLAGEDEEESEASVQELEDLDAEEQENGQTLGGLDDDVNDTAETPEETETVRKITVVGVRFRPAGRAYYFSPGDLQLRQGSKVIVETARGVEFGVVVSPPMQMNPRQVRQPLRTIMRIATTADCDREESNREKEHEAYRVCQDRIRRHHLNMKLIQAEYTFDGNKILFYFTADQRVDFRDLVKDLAGIFHTRIELRQIGVRDETKILGGYGICGRPLCCHTYLSDFVPVSIKMAKEQNLSLNPTKISGVCGRLMCCLKNEEETYEELNKNLPRIGDEVEAVDGLHGDVESVNVLRQRVRIIVEANDEKELHEYDAKDLTILRRRKRGQAKPKFRREEGSSNNGVTSHVKEAVAKRQQALADEAATLHAAAQQNAGAAAESAADGAGSSENGDGSRRNQRRDRTGRRGRYNDRNRQGQAPAGQSSGQTADARTAGRPDGQGGSRNGNGRGNGQNPNGQRPNREGRPDGPRGRRDDRTADRNRPNAPAGAADPEHPNAGRDGAGSEERRPRRNRHGRGRRNPNPGTAQNPGTQGAGTDSTPAS